MYGTQTALANPAMSDTACAQPTSLYRSTEEDQDSELLNFLRMGVPEAFSTLMDRYDLRLKRLAFGITKSHEDSEDAVQNTFFQVYKHVGAFRGDCKFMTWLTRIAINQSLQVLRRRKDPGISIHDFVDDGDAALRYELRASCGTPEENLLRKELQQKLLGALKTLREPSRRVAEMHYLHGLSTHEIAGAIGISTTAAKSRLGRARRELRREGARHLNPRCSAV